MKKKKLNKKLAPGAAAVVCALLLLKAVLAPSTVGKMGDVTITDGVYKMAQFQAYQTALNAATEEQAAMATGRFLEQSIPVDENGNPTAVNKDAKEEQPTVVVKQFVAEETERILRDYAAVESRFAALNGTLTAEQTAEADEYVAQMWESYGALYYNNGIKLADIKAYEYNYYKAQQLLALIYGTQGETPVGEQALTDCLAEQGLYGSYVLVPIYNTTSFTFADETQLTQMKEKAGAVVADYTANRGSAATGEQQRAVFKTALQQGLAQVYGVLGNEYDAAAKLDADLSEDLFLLAELEGSFTADDLAALKALQPGEAAVVQYSYYGVMIFLRGDALEEKTLADWEPALLSYLKSEELNKALEESAAGLENGLKKFAMNCYAPRSITLAY